jgi:hypothetical protein
MSESRWTHQLWLHTVAHLRFYRRNRLLLILVLLTAGAMTLPLIPAMMESRGGRFDLLKTMANQLDWLVWISAAGLGLFATSSHLRDRSAKLIFTRPGRPEVWLLSIFVSAFLVALAAQTAAAIVTLVLSLVWDVPYQIGFLYLTLDTLAQTAIISALLTMLGVSMHPVVAVLFVVFFNERTLYGVEFMLNLSQESYKNSWWPAPLRWTVHGVRCVMPSLGPFSDKMSTVHTSLHVTLQDWQYLAAAGGYALLVSAFLYFLSAWSLRRRSLV